MKIFIRVMALILTLGLMLPVVSCGGGVESDTEGSKESESQKSTEKESTSGTDTEESEDASEQTTEDNGNIEKVTLDGEYADIIEYADLIANGVQTAYNSDRTKYTVNNMNMSLEYDLVGDEDQMVAAIKNKNGVSYIENTMDVFVRMKDGKEYYASNSAEQTRVNIFRLGYYYYDVHFLEQTFNSLNVTKELEVPLDSFTDWKHTKKPVVEDGVLSVITNNPEDPQIISNFKYSAAEYNYLELTMRAEIAGAMELYLVAGSQTTHNSNQKASFTLLSGIGTDFVKVRIRLSDIPDYTGSAGGLRIDFPTSVGNKIEITSVKLLKVEGMNGPSLSLDRTLHTYSDKLHQELHIVATQNTQGIDCIGMITEIDASRVNKILAFDGEKHNDLNSVDWKNIKFIGFDLNDAGVFGYIMPYDGKGGSLKVTLEGDKYKIVQTASPENGTILAPAGSTANDFRMGQRIYTSSDHDLDKFYQEAYDEVCPLANDCFTLDKSASSQAKIMGYDSLRGAYMFTISSSGFNDSYYNHPNRHHYVGFNVSSKDHDRKIYIYAYGTSGQVECAVLLGKNDFLLPVPTEVIKNFSEKEEPIFNAGDQSYCETVIPLVVKSEEESYYKVVNLYQNWGRFPLKQLSAIPYYMPYYHLSTGVTETNCIAPWYNNAKNLYTLPDFRPMSMPMSSDLVNMYQQYGNQPQHPNTGIHRFLEYKDKDGNSIASEYLDNTISSSGPVYADVTMNYLSDDGKIKVSYRHIEFPQTDENRTYYEMQYEILEDLTIEEFRENFAFYSVTSHYNYSKLGYLDEDNECVIVTANKKTQNPVIRTLGDECPYFSFFYDPNANEYANVALLVYNSDICIGGEKYDGNFAIANYSGKVSLTLDISGDVTFKKGDKMTLNIILLPWGGSWKQDDGTKFEYKNDDLVRAVRENTLLDPLTVEASVGEVKEDVYLPEVIAENNTAEFTLSGGENNVAVRVYNFDYLTVPKIYEKINGEWVEYKVSSFETPDKAGFGHKYDGYSVFYDGDGTFSYSFVVAMADKNRTFKVVAEEYVEEDWVVDNNEVTFIDPSSGFKKSSVVYLALFDMINGEGEYGSPTYSYRGGNSVIGIDMFDFNKTTFSDGSLVFTGWTVVDGGVEKYVWSVDGGKTWHEATQRNFNGFVNGSSEHMKVAEMQLDGIKFTDPDKALEKCIYQSGVGMGENVAGLAAYLNDYEGETVNVIFAAIPKNEPDSLCLLAYVKDVEVKTGKANGQ